jgi:peptidoglycan/LPS O-acetylase OafA/YrhL
MHAETEFSTPPSGHAKSRLDFLDVAKAIGILCVIALHSFGRSAHLLAFPGSVQWWSLTLSNRLFAFAVPMFLCISAFLWARSQRKKEQVMEGYGKRLVGILHPYLVWTAIYLVWSIAVEKAPLGSLRGIHTWWNYLIWGKAYFHLYFLSILLQAALLFPLMYIAVRRTGFLAICGLAFVLQGLVFWSQTHWQYLAFPGSSVLWYITSLLPAAWLGYHWPLTTPSLRKLAIGSCAVTVLSVLPYLWLQILDIDNIHRWSGLSNPLQQVFVFGAAFWVLSGLALRGTRQAANPWMVWLGAVSLQFYLLHLIVMRLTSGPRITGFMAGIPGGAVLVYVLVLALTFGVVWILNKLRVEKVLFGRASPPLPARFGRVDKLPAE